MEKTPPHSARPRLSGDPLAQNHNENPAEGRDQVSLKDRRLGIGLMIATMPFALIVTVILAWSFRLSLLASIGVYAGIGTALSLAAILLSAVFPPRPGRRSPAADRRTDPRVNVGTDHDHKVSGDRRDRAVV